MKSQDIVILLKLVSLEQEEQEGRARPERGSQHEDPYSVRGLESTLGISKTDALLSSSDIEACNGRVP